MKDRKIIEIDHYDRKYSDINRPLSKLAQDSLASNLIESSCAAYRFAYKWLSKYSPQKTILDYGCGSGENALYLAQCGAQKVVGLDLAEQGLLIGKNLAKEMNLPSVEFIKGDCENTALNNSQFDIIFDSGTLSSLDFEKATNELIRILRRDGHIICVETFGHHPIANLKRRWNLITKRRTAWAVNHIFCQNSIQELRKHFSTIDIHYFHLLSYFTIPLAGHKWARLLVRFAEWLDSGLLKINWLKKYGFKVVIVLSDPH